MFTHAHTHTHAYTRTHDTDAFTPLDVFLNGCRYTSKGFVVGGVEYQGNVFLYQELSLLWWVLFCLFIHLQTQCATLTHLRTNVPPLVCRNVETVGDITPDSLLAARAVKPQPGESPDAKHLSSFFALF